MAMDQRMALASSAVTSKPPLSELDRGRQTRGRTKWGETQTKSKNKREKNEGEQRGGGAHWCWHGREPRHFNALVRGNSFQWEFGLAFTSICSNTQFAKWFVEGEQKRSAVCLCTFSGGFRSSPLASTFLFFLGRGARACAPCASISSAEMVYLDTRWKISSLQLLWTACATFHRTPQQAAICSVRKLDLLFLSWFNE